VRIQKLFPDLAQNPSIFTQSVKSQQTFSTQNNWKRLKIIKIHIAVVLKSALISKG